jgi:transcription initiation factor TFIIIB Brf1 subunit/transcription initiation factor TFIIB
MADFHPLPKNSGQQLTIIRDINLMDLPIQIKTRAISILESISPGIKRRRKRQQLIYFCVKTAYINSEFTLDLSQLAKLIGVDQKDMNIADNEYSEYSIGKPLTSSVIIKSPSEFIVSSCRELGLPDSYDDDILEQWTRLEQASKEAVGFLRINGADSSLINLHSFDDHYPQDIALANIIYYLTTNGEPNDLDKRVAKLKRSAPKIKALKGVIERLDNG